MAAWDWQPWPWVRATKKVTGVLPVPGEDRVYAAIRVRDGQAIVLPASSPNSVNYQRSLESFWRKTTKFA